MYTLYTRSLADIKVSTNSSVCIKANSEEIYSKSTISDFLLMVNSNCGRITFHFSVSVALLVARRTNNRKVVGSMPAKVVCTTVDR